MLHTTASTLEEIALLREELSHKGQKLVLTNGVFDLLHVGHIRYLAEARALGDCLVVAINDDASTRSLKGPSRPIHRAENRAEMLLALRSVDRVVIFSEKHATRVIDAIRPHIYVKGGDYTPDTLVGEEKALMDKLGTEIRILSLSPGESTTATLERVTEAEKKENVATADTSQATPRIAILGSGTGSNARALLAAAAEGRLGAEVSVVVCDVPGAGILDIAEEYGVPTLVIDPKSKKRGHLSDEALQQLTDELTAIGVDLVVCAGFMRILREPLLSAFPERVLNLHPSLLPKYPGLNSAARALEAGDAETGCTVHLIDAGIDTGPILRQAHVPIFPDDTVDSLTARIHEAEHHIYPEVVADLLRSRAAATSHERA